MIRNCPRKCHDIHTRKPAARKLKPYFRKLDSRWIKRWQCKICNKTFSEATENPRKWQKKRRINSLVLKLFASTISERRMAIVMGVNRKTIAHRRNFLSRLEETKEKAQWSHVRKVQFDDLETFEHTKCKPLSVCIAVDADTRRIIGYEVSKMPAKGQLAKIARKKYGHRPDERPEGWNRLLRTLKTKLSEEVIFVSDSNPHYPKYVKKYFPLAKHVRVKGKRGCITAQGELKRIGFDPLFSLNHTCAMFRASISRLIRKTWNTTKQAYALEQHIRIYRKFHNDVLVT